MSIIRNIATVGVAAGLSLGALAVPAKAEGIDRVAQPTPAVVQVVGHAVAFNSVSVQHPETRPAIGMRPMIAVGRTGDHAWLILSGADIASLIFGKGCTVVLSWYMSPWLAGPACAILAVPFRQVLNWFGPTGSHGIYITVGTAWYNAGRTTWGTY